MSGTFKTESISCLMYLFKKTLENNWKNESLVLEMLSHYIVYVYVVRYIVCE